MSTPASTDVTVFAFVVFDAGHELGVVAPYKAPRAVIEATPTARVLEGTAQRVPAHRLDAEGRLVHRLAVDWGRRHAG